MRTALVALGGNALLRHDEAPTLAAQRRNAALAARTIATLARRRRIVVTHGNGPQVGVIMRRSELAQKEAYALSLDAAVAQSEGEIGYVLEQALQRVEGRRAVALVTRVLVSRRDPAFRSPTKPIGRIVRGREAAALRRAGATLGRARGGWRRLVASPAPQAVLEGGAIRALVSAGFLVIAAGGGGIPVARTKRGLEGVEAVVDKDLASACLAREVGATELFLLTDVDAVYEAFGTARARRLPRLTTHEARRLQADGEFPPGSMGPKIEAALQFLSHEPRGRVRIGSLARPLAGTLIVGT